MINVAFVRGAYLNNFEGQNYRFDDTINLHGFSSFKSIHLDFPFPVTKLPSLTDMPVWSRALRFVANRTIGDAQVLYGLEKQAKEFDIFHTADPHYYYSYQLARMRKDKKIKKLLVTSWETIPHNNETVKAKERIKKYVLRYADHFLCYTEKAKLALMKEGTASEKISVIPLGVDLNIFKTNDKPVKKGTTYLFVGRLVPEKGIPDLYEAYRQIAGTDIRLRIIGNGPLKKHLAELIKKDNLSNRVTIEEKTYEEMPHVYRECDVFILPSKRTSTWEEQYGMVLVEAMSSGLPIVAYDTGAIREVVGDAGFLIRENDIKTLTGTLRRLRDWQLRVKLGTMGRGRAVANYDARLVAEKLKNLYIRLLKT